MLAISPAIGPAISGMFAPDFSSILTIDAQAAAFFAVLTGPKLWLDPSFASTRFQNVAGSTLVTADGQPFARLNDRSGAGNHVGVSLAQSMPLWKTDGTLSWAQPDGVDDFWQSLANFDLSSTSQATVIAGVRKTSDATMGIICEHGPTFGNVGTLALRGPTGSGTDNFGAVMNTGTIREAYSAAAISPFSAVLAGIFDGAADPSSKMLVNGVQTSSAAGASGSGKFISGLLNFFRRNGTSFPFSGRLYGLMIIGRLLTASELSLCQRWMASKSGVTLA